jgi:hypothetical protein
MSRNYDDLRIRQKLFRINLLLGKQAGRHFQPSRASSWVPMSAGRS